MPNLRQLPLRWILLLLIALPFGVHRIRLAMRSTEESVQNRIEFLLDALESKQPKRIVRSLSRDFVDESGGYSRSQVVEAARYILAPGQRYRGSLDEVDGLEFVEVSDDGEGPPTVTVRAHCLIETRVAQDEFVPWWDFTFTADMERQSGTWMIMRTRDIDHSKRPRR